MMNVSLFDNVKRVKTAKRREEKVSQPTEDHFMKSSQENSTAQISYDDQYIKDGMYHVTSNHMPIK